MEQEPRFYYVDTIRDKNGKLRSWEAHNELSLIEDKFKAGSCMYFNLVDVVRFSKRKREIDNENGS